MKFVIADAAHEPINPSVEGLAHEVAALIPEGGRAIAHVPPEDPDSVAVPLPPPHVKIGVWNYLGHPDRLVDIYMSLAPNFIVDLPEAMVAYDLTGTPYENVETPNLLPPLEAFEGGPPYTVVTPVPYTPATPVPDNVIITELK
jgi:hypothetical protein